MSTPAQKAANRENAQKSTGPTTDAGKAKSCMNRLSHGFNSSVIFLAMEDPDEFNALLADFQTEFQPATPCEQVLLEKVVYNQWLSLRAARLQSIALSASIPAGLIHKDLAVLIRYSQTAERAFLRFRTELLNAQKERKKSEIGFEPQTPEAEPPEPPKVTPQPAPVQVSTPLGDLLKAQLLSIMHPMPLPPDYAAKKEAARLKAEQQAA